MNLVDALNSWVELSGVDPSDKKTTFTFSEWSVKSLHEIINEALQLEDSNHTGMMMFDFIVRDYFSERTFSVEKIISDPEGVKSYIDKSAKLLDYLNGPDMTEVKKSYRDNVLSAVEQYGFVRSDLISEINNDVAMAIIRRDALRSVKNLSVHQFLKGDFCSDDVKPVFGKHLYRWWNINSMLNAMVNMPNGITLNLIANEDGHKTYFCFCIRNGGNLFVFTDKSSGNHPMYEDMIRRPDRYLAERALKNYFPYSKAGMVFDEKGGAYIKGMSNSTSIVPLQSDIEKLCPIGDFESAELIWISLMFSLIVDKFWKGKYQAPELAYTGDMLKVENKLLLEAKKANLPIEFDSKSIEVSEIEIKDVWTENVKQSDVGEMGNNGNAWLEKRYKGAVTKEILNTTSLNGGDFCFDNEKKQVRNISSHERSFGLRQNTSLSRVSSFNLCSFGTEATIKADRMFVARFNYASVIQTEAQKEYDLRVDEIKKFVKSKIEENSKVIFNDVLNQKTTCRHREYLREDIDKHSYNYTIGGVKYFTSNDNRRNDWSCFLTGAVWNHLITITPNNVNDLAYLCGCEVKDLPDVIQHWKTEKLHGGNHILDRIDPMEWALHSPWNNIDFKVCIFLSKRGRKQFEKLYKG